MQAYGLYPDGLDERQFTPRLLLGENFRDQLLAMIDQARDGGMQIDILDHAEVADITAREAQDPFRWARKNLDEVEYNKSHKITVPWRYALLGMHEVVEAIIPDLSEADRKRFDDGLKTVFVDNYAAVPSESIRRLLALRDARLLSILALGQDYDLQRKAKQTLIHAKGADHLFNVFIDARGEKPLTRAAIGAAVAQAYQRARDHSRDDAGHRPVLRNRNL